MNRMKKLIIIVMATIEMAMFSGIFYGYNSLIPIYKKEGVFSQYCENSQNTTHNATENITHNRTISCIAQETYYGKAFASWLVVQGIMCFFLGIILDKFGIRTLKTICGICFLGGTLCFAFTAKLNWLLFIAGSLLTMSAHGLNISNYSLSILFKGKGNLIVSLIGALHNFSSIIMSVMKYLADLGIPFWISFTCYGCVGFSFIMGSLAFIKSRAKDMLTKVNEGDEGELNEEKMQVEKIEVEVDETESKIESVKSVYEKATEERFQTFKKCILSPEYFIHVTYFIIICFRFTFFLSQMSSQLKYLFPTQPEIIDHLLFVSNFFFIGSLIVLPIYEFLVDKYLRYTFGYLSKDSNISPRHVYNKVNGIFAVSNSVCSFSTLVAALVLFVPNRYLFYLVFICITITRSILFAVNAGYLFSAFPKRYFGTLIGSVFLVSGFINISQQFIIPFASPNSHPDIVNYILLGLCAVSFVNPLYLKLKK